ncbi:MAG: class I SAM-dependent methyltransferase [Promethearchaeota archaeon]
MRKEEKSDIERIKYIYDQAAMNPIIYYLDAFFGMSTQNSLYRKIAIANLDLKENFTVLDLACGTGYNFKIIEKYLKNTGKLIGIDVSAQSLRAAKKRARKHGWTNIELINIDFTRYEPKDSINAVLTTLALEIIPDYKTAIDKIHKILLPKGRFSMIGMKLNNKVLFKPLNIFLEKISRSVCIDYNRGIPKYIKFKFGKIDFFKEFNSGYFYILTVRKR